MVIFPECTRERPIDWIESLFVPVGVLENDIGVCVSVLATLVYAVNMDTQLFRRGNSIQPT